MGRIEEGKVMGIFKRSQRAKRRHELRAQEKSKRKAVRRVLKKGGLDVPMDIEKKAT